MRFSRRHRDRFVKCARLASRRSWHAIAAIVLVAVGCSRTVRLRVRIVAPSAQAMLPEKLHVAGAKACPAGSLAKPDPTAEKSDAEFHRVRTDGEALDVESAFHGGDCILQLAAWYDANGNGIVDVGDSTGATEPLRAIDRGLCAGNLTEAPDLHLAAVR